MGDWILDEVHGVIWDPKLPGKTRDQMVPKSATPEEEARIKAKIIEAERLAEEGEPLSSSIQAQVTIIPAKKSRGRPKKDKSAV